MPLIIVWTPSITVSVNSARFQTGSSPRLFDAARIPTAATANPAAASTPINAAGSAALDNTLRIRSGAASQATPGDADGDGDPTEAEQRFAERHGRHDGHEDHLGLGVDRADREVAQVEGPQQCDRAEDLGGAGAGEDQPEPAGSVRQRLTDQAERHQR